MNTSVAETMIKMLEAVPDQLQENVVEHMRDYIEDIRDEAIWNASFARTQDKLVAAAQQARREIAGGKSSPFDSEKL
ncbi:MAG TPA: hypothetical protein DDY86_11195 [Syntrophaceae bacterium]|jgi:hypothetical protein|nr:hypothetical protein [Syntrophaceae bacterium]